jgi:hypothetical protein
VSSDEDSIPTDPEEYEPSVDAAVAREERDLDKSLDPPTPGEDIDPETYGLFWRLVVVVDVALIALALGPMFIYFEGDWDVGAPLVGLGLVSLGYGYLRYRHHEIPSEDEETTGSPASESDETGDGPTVGESG